MKDENDVQKLQTEGFTVEHLVLYVGKREGSSSLIKKIVNRLLNPTKSKILCMTVKQSEHVKTSLAVITMSLVTLLILRGCQTNFSSMPAEQEGILIWPQLGPETGCILTGKAMARRNYKNYVDVSFIEGKKRFCTTIEKMNAQAINGSSDPFFLFYPPQE